jgi:hypothetical protein
MVPYINKDDNGSAARPGAVRPGAGRPGAARSADGCRIDSRRIDSRRTVVVPANRLLPVQGTMPRLGEAQRSRRSNSSASARAMISSGGIPRRRA